MMLTEMANYCKPNEIEEKIENNQNSKTSCAGVTPLEIVEHFATNRSKTPMNFNSPFLNDNEKTSLNYDENSKFNHKFEKTIEQIESINYLKSRFDSHQSKTLNKELKKESIDNFKDNLSNLIKARYKTESLVVDTSFSQTNFVSSKTKSDAPNTNRSRAQSLKSKERASKNNETFDDDFNNTENLKIYGKNIDHLSTEILTAFNNGIKKSGINSII